MTCQDVFDFIAVVGDKVLGFRIWIVEGCLMDSGYEYGAGFFCMVFVIGLDGEKINKLQKRKQYIEVKCYIIDSVDAWLLILFYFN